MSPSDGLAYITPKFDPTDPIVARCIEMRPSLWTVFFNILQQWGQANQWRQNDPTHASVAEVVAEIINITDKAVFAGCGMIGDVKYIAREPAPFELVCNGMIYNRVDYPDLYAVLNPVYIIDADQFITPDLFDEFIMGGDESEVGDTGGTDTVTLTVGNLPAHHHSYEKIVPTLTDPGVTPSVIGIEDINTEDTGDTGSGEAFSIINPYHKLIPVIVATYPQAG